MNTEKPDHELFEMRMTRGRTWIIRGDRNNILGYSPSLEAALDKAWEHREAETALDSIIRMPTHDIVVGPHQMLRLWRQMRLGILADLMDRSRLQQR